MVKRQATQQQKILILAAIPHGLRLDKEIREVEECIRPAVRLDMFEVDIRTAVRPQDIRRAIAFAEALLRSRSVFQRSADRRRDSG